MALNKLATLILIAIVATAGFAAGFAFATLSPRQQLLAFPVTQVGIMNTERIDSVTLPGLGSIIDTEYFNWSAFSPVGASEYLTDEWFFCFNVNITDADYRIDIIVKNGTAGTLVEDEIYSGSLKGNATIVLNQTQRNDFVNDWNSWNDFFVFFDIYNDETDYLYVEFNLTQIAIEPDVQWGLQYVRPIARTNWIPILI